MRYTLILFLLLFNSKIHPQKTVIGYVNYGHIQSMGMGGPVGVDYNALLIFDNYQAIYHYAKDSLEGGRIRESVSITRDDGAIMVRPKNTSEEGFIHYTNISDNLFKSRDLGFKYVKESIPKINWSIKDETKKIGQFVCKKAICEFRGRNYTAWFTTQVPLPFGPWKLQGLPGIILEAYDTNKEVYFYFKSIKYPSEKKLTIEIPNAELENKKWMSFEEFKKFLINAYHKGFQNARMVMEQANMEIISEDRKSMKTLYIESFID